MGKAVENLGKKVRSSIDVFVYIRKRLPDEFGLLIPKKGLKTKTKRVKELRELAAKSV